MLQFLGVNFLYFTFVCKQLLVDSVKSTDVSQSVFTILGFVCYLQCKQLGVCSRIIMCLQKADVMQFP